VLEISEEVQDALGRSYNMPDVDEDELEAELEALGEEIALDDDTSYLDEAVNAPNAPDKAPSGREEMKNAVRNRNLDVNYLCVGRCLGTGALLTHQSCKPGSSHDMGACVDTAV